MKQITKIGGSFGFKREERQWRNFVQKLQRKKYNLRESWIVADIQENMYRQKLTASLRERGIDYQAICENQRIQLRKRSGRSGRATDAKERQKVRGESNTRKGGDTYAVSPSHPSNSQLSDNGSNCDFCNHTAPKQKTCKELRWTCAKCGGHRHFGNRCIDCKKES